MQNAVIAIEDERFETHYGVDWKRTIAAFANLVLHFSSNEFGGSTITQQLIKVLTEEDDHRIERKITEILRAIEMEKQYTKDEIIQAYLNVLPLSSGIKGVGAAANYYFGVEAEDLTIAQCAVIASITQNVEIRSLPASGKRAQPATDRAVQDASARLHQRRRICPGLRRGTHLQKQRQGRGRAGLLHGHPHRRCDP